MESVLINNAILPDALDGGTTSVSITDGRIDAIGPDARAATADRVIDLEGARLFPGFVDVHCHGAVGVDVNNADLDGLMAVSEFLAREGVTAWMPTLVPDSDDNYRRVIDELDRLIDLQTEMPIAQAVGVHYEGVFANEKMCGALRPEFFKKFTGGEVALLPRLKRGVHMTTFAPEIDGGIGLVGELAKRGWIASIGHTRASLNVLDEAYAAGARHLTHFYNAMTGLHHREPGVVGWALANEGVTFDIIADGIHVHPTAIAAACRAKGADGVSLISDSIAPTGLGDGSFDLWGETITVANGRTQNERGSIAGSVITMADAVRSMLSWGFGHAEAAKMASSNPATLLGIEAERGSIDVGKRADLAAIDGSGRVTMVIVGGREIAI